MYRKSSPRVIIDGPELVNDDLAIGQLDGLSNQTFVPTTSCSIPLYHHPSLPNDCTKIRIINGAGIMTVPQRSISLQQGLDDCIDLKAYHICVRRLVRMLQNTKFLHNKNIIVEIEENGKLLLEYRRSCPRKFSLQKCLSPVHQFVLELAVKAFHKLLKKIYLLVTNQPHPSMPSKEACKLMRNIRIVRILQRVSSRLLKDHGTLFVSLMTGLISYEALLPICEPVLYLEEQCCREFLRLCLEYAVYRYKQIVNEDKRS